MKKLRPEVGYHFKYVDFRLKTVFVKNNSFFLSYTVEKFLLL